MSPTAGASTTSARNTGATAVAGGRTSLYQAAILSGTSALLFETVWVRQFTLLIGANTPSVSVVLSVYMAGLALGAVLAPRLAASGAVRRSRYALVEVTIGAGGLGLTVLLAWLNGQPWPLPWPVGLALSLMLAVTVLIGTTTPLLVGLLPRHGSRPDRPVGWLYAANTVGAAAGALVGGLVLGEHLGLVGSCLVAAALNLGAAFVALRAPLDDPIEATSPSLALRHPPWLLAALVGATSLFGMATEVLLTRVLVMILSSHASALALLLGGLLLGLAIGGLVAAHWRWLTADPRLSLAVALVALAVLAAAMPHLLIALRHQESALLAWVGASWPRFFLVNAAAILSLTVPLGMVLGAVPPIAVVAIARGHASLTQSVGWVGLMSGLGSIAGPPLAAFVLLPWLGLGRSWTLLGGAIGAFGVATLATSGRRRLTLVCAAGLLALLAAVPGDVTARLVERQDRLIAAWDSSFGSAVVVEEPSGVRHLLTNIGGAVGDDSPTHVMMQRRQYLLPALLAPRRERVVEIGLGTGISVSPVTRDDAVARLWAIEISPAVIAGAGLFAEHNLGVLAHPKVEVVLDDGRAWLRRQREPFDLILVELFNSEETGISALYSEQFYRLCASRLRPGGVLAQGLSLVELPDQELLSVLAAMSRAFPSVELWNLFPNILLATASDTPFSGVSVRVDAALADPELGPLLRRAGLRGTPDILGRRLLDVRSSGLVTGSEPVDDDRPAFEARVPRHLFFLGRNWHEVAVTCRRLEHHLEGLPPSLADDLSPALLRQLALRSTFLAATAAHFAGPPGAEAAAVDAILRADPENVDALLLNSYLP